MERPDRTVRILTSRGKPMSVKPSDPVDRALTMMLLHDFSQLPVLNDEQRAAGILRWPTVVKRLLDGEKPAEAGQWMTEAQTMSADRSIYDAFAAVLEHEYVLVTENGGQVVGIVTAYDLSMYADRVLMPFLIVEDIELALRDTLDVCGPLASPKSSPQQHDGLPSLGRLINLLNNSENWSRLKTKLRQEVVIDALVGVRDIRNSLMHFILRTACSSKGSSS